jgi:hypothetical protein
MLCVLFTDGGVVDRTQEDGFARLCGGAWISVLSHKSKEETVAYGVGYPLALGVRRQGRGLATDCGGSSGPDGVCGVV